MVRFFSRWIASIAALYITVYVGRWLDIHLWLQPGIKGFVAATVVTTVLVVLNAVVAPVLKLLTLPINCLTFGLFGLLINALIFWSVGQSVTGFHVRGPLAAVFGTVAMGLISGALSFFVRDRKPKRK